MAERYDLIIVGTGFAGSGFRPAVVAGRPDAQFFYSYLGAIDNPTANRKTLYIMACPRSCQA